MNFGGRKEAFRSLVGSNNYNLATKTSDKDYKLFVMPTFDDLYFSNQFSKTYIGEVEDFDAHDIRKTSSLWWKANINFVEALFSIETVINPDLDTETQKAIKEIFARKNDIAKMNLPYLYDACIGMHITKKKQVDKGTEGTQHLVDKYGYDTKQASHSVRVLDFLTRFADNDFTDFKQAIWYYNDDPSRKLLLDIKNGEYSKEEFIKMADEKLSLVVTSIKEKYKSQLPDEETNNFLLGTVKDIVKRELF
jgi:predicted nucleotidyltransferase